MQRKKESLIVKQAQKKRSIRSHRNDVEDDDEGKEKEKKSDDAKNEDSKLSTDLIQKEEEKEEETTNETEDDKQENVVVDEATKAKDFQKGMIEKMKQLRRLVDPKFREWEANGIQKIFIYLLFSSINLLKQIILIYFLIYLFQPQSVKLRRKNENVLKC